MKTPKFDFIPERQLTSKEQMVVNEPTVSIYVNGQITFSPDYIEQYPMDGKYVRFYADTMRKTIGWSVIEGNTSMESLNDSRLVNATAKGLCKISIQKLLCKLGWEKGNSMIDLPVKIYKSPMMVGDIHYVKLPDKVVSLSGEKSIPKTEPEATETN